MTVAGEAVVRAPSLSNVMPSVTAVSRGASLIASGSSAVMMAAEVPVASVLQGRCARTLSASVSVFLTVSPRFVAMTAAVEAVEPVPSD